MVRMKPWKPLVALVSLALLVAGPVGCAPPPGVPTLVPSHTPPAPTDTPVPPTATPLPPTDTPLPPTPTPLSPTDTPLPPAVTPTAAAVTAYSRDDWGLAFQHPAGWEIMAESDEQAILVHRADLTMFLVHFEARELGFSAEALRALLETFAGPAGDVEIGEAEEHTIGGQDAAMTQVSATIEGIEMSGSIALVTSPDGDSSFVLLAWTLKALSEQQQPTFDAIFDSVAFSPPRASGGTATPAPVVFQEDELEIINARHYADLGGTLHVVGEVWNKRDVAVEDVRVLVRLFDDDGAMLTDERWSITMNLIPAGDRSPFEVLFLDPPEYWFIYEMRASGEPADFMLVYTYTDLEIVKHSGQVPDHGNYQISGLVRNMGDKDAQFVQVTATLYDDEGTVVAMGYTYAEADVLQAGATSSFAMTFYDWAAPADSYRLLVQGTEAD
jgi:hypothetical protein